MKIPEWLLLGVLILTLNQYLAADQLQVVEIQYKNSIQITSYLQNSKLLDLVKNLEARINLPQPKDKYIPLPPTKHLELIVLDPETYFQRTGAPQWVNPFYYKGKIFLKANPAWSNADLNQISRSLRHELTHAIIDYWSNDKVPFWFDEGLAKWSEGELSNYDILLFYKNSNLTPLAELNSSFTTMPKEQALAAYVQSFLAVQYIFETFGEMSLNNILIGMQSETDFEKTLLAVTGLNSSALDNRLKKYVKSWINKNINLLKN